LCPQGLQVINAYAKLAGLCAGLPKMVDEFVNRQLVHFLARSPRKVPQEMNGLNAKIVGKLNNPFHYGNGLCVDRHGNTAGDAGLGQGFQAGNGFLKGPLATQEVVHGFRPIEAHLEVNTLLIKPAKALYLIGNQHSICQYSNAQGCVSESRADQFRKIGIRKGLATGKADQAAPQTASLPDQGIDALGRKGSPRPAGCLEQAVAAPQVAGVGQMDPEF
jgi:hypothetical protein